MKRIVFFLLISNFLPITIGILSAQTTITGQIKNSANQKIYLSLQKGSEPEVVDSVVTDAKGSFTMPLKAGSKQGLYQLRIEKENGASFVINNEARLTISAEPEYMKQGIVQVINSKENDAYAVFTNFFRQYTHEIDSLQTLLRQISRFDAKYEAKTRDIKKAYALAVLKFNNTIRLIPGMFPKSFAAEVLLPLNLVAERSEFDFGKDFDTDEAFQHAHFFDFINFSDPRIVNTTTYESKLYTYLDSYVEHTEAGFKKGVDNIMKGAVKNTEVRDFTVAWLLQVFTKKGPPALVEYVNDNYSQGCDIPMNSETQKLLGKLKKVTIGTPAAELVINDINYSPVSMKETLKGKVGMLYFWASTCIHCMEHTPKVFEVYQKYKSKSFEVYAVSLDSDYAAWLKAIQDMKLEWINVSDLKGWSSSAIDTYALERTPSIFLVDKNGNILDKNFSPDELEGKLKEYLK